MKIVLIWMKFCLNIVPQIHDKSRSFKLLCDWVYPINPHPAGTERELVFTTLISKKYCLTVLTKLKIYIFIIYIITTLTFNLRIMIVKPLQTALDQTRRLIRFQAVCRSANMSFKF